MALDQNLKMGSGSQSKRTYGSATLVERLPNTANLQTKLKSIILVTGQHIL